MRQSVPVVKTKVTLPSVGEAVMYRPKLMKKLQASLHHPVTLIHAGPGYGKSTALAMFVRHQPLPTCWYSISELDADLPTFLTHLVGALREQIPTFGADWLSQLHNQRIHTERGIRALCADAVNELNALSTRVLLVLDDVHVVLGSDAIRIWMETFLEYLPDTVRLILSSRVVPQWDVLTRMRLKGRVMEISDADLLFSDDEIEVLFADHYGHPLTPDERRLVAQKTEGWAIALQLIGRQLAASGDLAALRSREAQTLDELFRYLALDVFQKQPEPLRRFLVQTSILEVLSVEACRAIFDLPEAAKLVDQAVCRHLFLLPIGEDQYRYHALFRNFLEQQLRDHPDCYRALHRRAAAYFLDRRCVDQALHHLRMAEDWTELAKTLSAWGAALIDSGKMEKVLDVIHRMPRESKDSYPMVWRMEGDIYRYRSRFAAALACYERAERLAIAQGDVVEASRAVAGQALVYLDTIQPGKAEELLARAVQLVQRDPDADVDTQVWVYSLVAENFLNLGHAAEADKWYAKSRSLCPDYRNDAFEIRLLLRTGRLAQARERLERQKRREKGDEGSRVPHAHRETDLLLALIHVMMGEPDTAKLLAESAIRRGRAQKAPFVEACGWMRLGHALQLMEGDTLAQAQACYETALAIMEELNVSRGKAEPLMGLCLLHGRAGALEVALRYGEQALAEVEAVKDRWLGALIRLSLGIAFAEAGDWEAAMNRFRACEDAFGWCGDQYGLLLALLWQALAAYQTERRTDFAACMARALPLMETGNYTFLVRRRTLFGPRDVQALMPLLVESQHRRLHRRFVDQVLADLGLSGLSTHPGYTLRIETLGDFRVYLGHRRVEEKEWQREKAKLLFQFFVTRRNRFVPRSEILDALWPNGDAEAALRDFKVALHAVHKVLEPQRSARSTPFFLQRKGTTYGFNPAAGLWVDVAEFEAWVRAGLEETKEERARTWLEKGLALYKGEYLPGVHEAWCVVERERLNHLFLRGAERLAQLLLRAGDFDAAIGWGETILNFDPCWEEAYRLLMYAYWRKNNRPRALRWYRQCCEVLRAELGVEPMPATRELFERIREV